MPRTPLLSSALLVIGLATQAQGSAIPNPASDTELVLALEQARAAVAKADSAGFAWRGTQKLLDQAEEARQLGDRQQALKLALRAQREGEAGYRQFQASRNAGPRWPVSVSMAADATGIPQSLDDLMADARDAVAKANAVGFAWRGSATLLSKAEEAAQTGDEDKARALATRARLEGLAGYQQYEASRQAGPRF